MSEPFLGEIRAVAFDYAPPGWALCNGQVLAISQFQALFSLLGTTYGGNGSTTFALPNLVGRVPMHTGANFPLGSMGGSETITLTQAQLPAHTHSLSVSNTNPTSNLPASNALAHPANSIYAATANSLMAVSAVSPAGNSQPYDNTQPSLVINFIIALQGIFPSPN